MFGSPAIVRGTAEIFKGHLLEAFNQGDRAEGLGTVMGEIPEAAQGVCKSLCMHWVAHHANDEPGRFSDVARAMGSGARAPRRGGYYNGVGMALTQIAYTDALRRVANHADYNRAKDQFTDDFLRSRGILRQMKISNPALNMTPPKMKIGVPGRWVNSAFAWRLGEAIVGKHTADYWSYKIISIHGRAGGHAVAAFVGADAVFFDPNYGLFYFKKADDFRRWFSAPGGFYWESGYVDELGDDCVIKSYAKGI